MARFDHIFVEEKPCYSHCGFVNDCGVIENVDDEASVNVCLVCFDDDEGNVDEFLFDKGFGFFGELFGFLVIVAEFVGVDTSESEALLRPCVEAEVDADFEGVAVDDFFDDGFVDVKWVGVAFEKIFCGDAFGVDGAVEIVFDGFAQSVAAPFVGGGLVEIEKSFAFVFDGEQSGVMGPTDGGAVDEWRAFWVGFLELHDAVDEGFVEREILCEIFGEGFGIFGGEGLFDAVHLLAHLPVGVEADLVDFIEGLLLGGLDEGREICDERLVLLGFGCDDGHGREFAMDFGGRLFVFARGEHVIF